MRLLHRRNFLNGLALAGFLAAHPAVVFDVAIIDTEFDTVREEYDAGFQLGEVIEHDMIPVPVSAEQRGFDRKARLLLPPATVSASAPSART